MLKKDRQEKILNYLKEVGRASYDEIAKYIDISIATIRRDAKILVDNKMITQISGGLELRNIKSDIDIGYRMVKNIDKKRKLAKKAAKYIKANDLIYLDSGTTVSELIPYIKNMNVKVVTNGMMHLDSLIENNIETIVIGGILKPKTKSVVGSFAVEQVQNFSFDACFMGANAYSKALGYMTPDYEEAMIKKTVIENSKNVYILADSSKNNKESNVKFAKFDKCTLIDER